MAVQSRGLFDSRVDLVAKQQEIDGFGKKRLGAALQCLALGVRIAIGGNHDHRHIGKIGLCTGVRSHPSTKFGKEHSRPRQNDPDFRELARLRIDLNRPAMLLDDDVVTDGQAKPSAFSGGLGREERVEHLLLHLRRNASAVVADPDFDAVAKVFGRGSKGWLVIAAIRLCSALGRCVKAIGNQIEQDPCDVLREHIDFAGGRVKRPLQRDIEALLLGPRPVIGEIEALLDEGVDIDKPVFA